MKWLPQFGQTIIAEPTENLFCGMTRGWCPTSVEHFGQMTADSFFALNVGQGKARCRVRIRVRTRANSGVRC